MRINRLTLWILISLVAGVGLGLIFFWTYPRDPETDGPHQDLLKILDYMTIVSDVFLRLIKMIIAPLVLSTLIAGVAKLGDLKAVGRIGGKTMLWFVSASFVSLLLGSVLYQLFFGAGINVHVDLPASDVATGIDKGSMTVRGFITHVFPKSVAEAMAQNEILQIVVFSLFLGTATAAIGEKGKPIIEVMESLGHAMLKVTSFVMNLAPLAVFVSVAAMIAKLGPKILITYGEFIGKFYIALIILWTLLLFVGWIIIRRRIKTLVTRLGNPLMVAFTTASSESVYPKLLEELERFGCRNRIVSFVLPLGYSFNLDGSMMYMTFASLFIANLYNVPLSAGDQLVMLLTLMVTSKGIAGVPRASLVVIAGTIASFGIPEAGILILLPIDHLLDMGRSATNVIGNAVATVAVSKWEKSLDH